MSSQRAKLLLSAFFILWLFFVLASFFAVQKPFSATSALAFGRVLLDLLAAGWLVLIAIALGTWLLQRLLPIDSPLMETLILGAGLGLGVLGLLGLARRLERVLSDRRLFTWSPLS